MHRILVSLGVFTAFTAAATAQICFNPVGGTSVVPSLIQFTGADPVADEGRTPPLAMGITFPMAGVATPLTHCVIETNGVMYLSGAAGPAGLPVNYTYGSLANLRGAAGSSPRIAPFWRDIQNMPTGWDITVESVPGVSYTVRWLNTTDYAATGPARSFSATLFASGAIEFSYGNFTIINTVVGVSAGNAVGSSTTAPTNLAAGGSTGVLALAWEGFASAAVWDLTGKTIRFAPNGSGGYTITAPCAPPPATHTSYGAGCYTASDSYYSLLGDAVVANAALQGRTINFLKTPTTYLVTTGGGVFLPPSVGAAPVFPVATDDGESTITPSIPLATPQGPQATLRVHSNGLVSWGGAGQTFPGGNSWTPSAGAFLNASIPAIWAWHDFNESEAGSGRIVWEQIAGKVYITWNNVENYSVPAAINRSTMQIQLTLATGNVSVVFQNVDSNPTSQYGSATLVGYSPGGPSTDGGSQDLSTSLPYLIPSVNLAPVALTASPAPVSTATTGTVVTYTHTGVPEAAPGISVYLGLTILSVGQDLAGIDLGFLGAPGCKLHVTSLEATFAFVGVASTQTTTFALPPGVPAGFSLYAQGVALVAANSLPNGQNNLGAVLSNAIQSTVQAQ